MLELNLLTTINMYAAVTRDDISRAGKSSLTRIFRILQKEKPLLKLAKAPGQIVKKRYGGRISVKQEDDSKG